MYLANWPNGTHMIGVYTCSLVTNLVMLVSSFVLGMNALENESVWREMYLRSLDFGRRGVFVASISAIDVALWDIKGKLMGMPVSTLLGGRKNEQIKTYATGLYFTHGGNQTEKLIEEALHYKDSGFRGIKMKVGLDISRDVEYVTAVKKSIGDDVELMIDANHAYNAKEAFALIERLKDFNLSWFEEPVSPEDYKGYSQLRERSHIPIAGGECEYLRYGFLEMFQNRPVDIAQPDICAAGGITEVKRIATMANTFGVEVVPHTWGTGVALHAAMHLISNLDIVPGRMFEELPWMELDRSENQLRDEMVEPLIVPENGLLNVPSNPVWV